MAKKKSFFDKLVTKTSDKTASKLADKISSGIVNSVSKPKKKETKASTVEEKPKKTARSKKTAATTDPEPAQQATRDNTNPSNGDPMMAARYNTKRCPNCQAICFNSPADCPYCFQDLRGVKPLTPKEFDELNQ